jgi:hypothetical protein
MNIQDVSKMLAEISGVPKTQKQGKKYVSMYDSKHLVFEVEPPRSPDINNLEFYVWRYSKPLVHSASI